MLVRNSVKTDIIESTMLIKEMPSGTPWVKKKTKAYRNDFVGRLLLIRIQGGRSTVWGGGMGIRCT